MAFDTEMFIVEIQNRPSIWDCTTSDYANREVKKKNWEELVAMFGGAQLDIGEKKELGYLLQKKWKGLRTCYSREIKRRQTAKLGYRADRKSEYVYFNQLQFLQKVTAKSRTLEDDKQFDKEEISEEIEEGVETSVDRSVKKQRKASSHIENENDQWILTSHKSIDTRQRQQEEESDEDRMFLLSMLRALKSVPEEIKLATKIKLLSVLNEATEYNFINTQHASQPYQRSSTSLGQTTHRSEWRSSKQQCDPLLGTHNEKREYCEEQDGKLCKNRKNPRRHR